MPFVLDSYALIAHLEDETGGKRVREILRQSANGDEKAYLSMISFGEVAYITEREQGIHAAHRAIGLVDQLPITVVPATRSRVFAAARIKATTAVAYADAFAASAAQEFRATLLTGDPEFRALETTTLIEWL